MVQETTPKKRDADYIFYELTRSICPKCLSPIDAQILLKEGRVIIRKRCPDHGWFEALISSDAEMYLSSLRYNKPESPARTFAGPSIIVPFEAGFDCGWLDTR